MWAEKAEKNHDFGNSDEKPLAAEPVDHKKQSFFRRAMDSAAEATKTIAGEVQHVLGDVEKKWENATGYDIKKWKTFKSDLELTANWFPIECNASFCRSLTAGKYKEDCALLCFVGLY